jgi:hypothetical protein
MPPSATTWIAPPVPSPVADLLADLGRAFDALGIPWYLFGAQAAIVYGVARLTADVDVTARIPTGDASWLDVIDANGFARRFSDARFALQSRVIVLKVLAARPKDIEDVGALLRIQGERIDEARVRAVLHDLEAALGQTDLVPTFDAIRHRR